MNKKKLILLTSLVTVVVMAIVLSLSTVGVAKVNNAKSLKLKLKKPDITDLVFVAVNNWNYVMRNNGSYMYDSPDADGNHNNAGGEFPRGTGITIVYAGGLYIGTIKNGVPVVSETEFATEFQPGPITNSGVAFEDLTADNPLSADNQVYLVDRSGSGDDYNNWPGPVTSVGLPAVIADAQTWAVFNDLDVTLNSESDLESPFPGLGMEVVAESFAFNAGPLSDVVYVKLTITNKTSTNYPDSYLGAWMDADVNNSSNDIVGVDTARGLGFVYNNTNEGAGQDFATGFDFFQGPVVNATDVSASLAAKNAANTTVLVYDPVKNVYVPTALPAGKIWLGATAFNTYANGTDPIDNNERYNLLAGRDKSSGIPKSGCGLNDYYAFRGNPITGQGTCDVAGSANPVGGLFATAADQRILHGVGPFTIEAGSSQEIWLGIVGAGGTNRLTAVSNMFATDDLAQVTFSAGLVAPKPPATPKISVTALNGAVSIVWQNNAELEGDDAGEILGITTANGYSEDYVKYDFQGYRVYRSLTGIPTDFERLAEYDLSDGITVINNMTLNTLGHLDISDIVVGTDNGLQYNYIDQDVTNMTRYYYSVTAYDAQPYISTSATFTDPINGLTVDAPSGLPITLETAKTANVVSIVPMASVVGVSDDAHTTDATHTGPSDGSIGVSVVDPSKVQSGTYTISFREIPTTVGTKTLVGDEFLPSNLLVYEAKLGSTVRTISSRADDPRTFYDANANGTFDTGVDSLLDDSKFGVIQVSATDPSTETPIIVDGLSIYVYGPALDFKAFDVTANAGGPVNPPAGGAATFQGFPSSDPDLVNDQQVNGSFWFVADWRSATLTTGAYAQFVTNAVDDWNGWGNLVPYDFEYRFTAGGSVGQFRNTTTQANVPFEVWNVSTGTRLMIDWLNDAATGNFQLVNADHPASGGNNDPRTCRFYITQPATLAAGTAGYDAWVILNDNLAANYDYVIGRQVFVNWNGGDVGVGVYNAPLPETGTIFRINTTKPNTATDAFTFDATASTITTSKSALKKGLKNVKVVPNPYYGRSTYQASLFDKQIKFTNLPATCDIKIFTVAGDLVATLRHNDLSNNNRVNTNPLDLAGTPTAKETSSEVWNLQNADGKYVASGMYIALIDAPGIGKKLVKFAVIQEAIQINGPDVR